MKQQARAAAIVGLLVLAAALVGIWSRPAGLLAAVWPANALLLGVLARWRWLACPGGWAGAVAGYLLADLLTGSELDLTLSLTLLNLVGVVVGYLILAMLDPADREIRRPGAVLIVGGVCVASALGASALSPWLGAHFFDQSAWDALATWFSSELANYLAVLPVVLTVPGPPWRRERRRPDGERRADEGVALDLPVVPGARLLGGPWAPAAGLAIALALGAVVGGPAALVFALPVLLWSALRGDVFQTSVLVLVNTVVTMVAVSLGRLTADLNLDDLADSTKLEVQLGLSVASLGPLMVAASMTVRDRALRDLARRADRDALTGALAREAFTEQAGSLIAACRSQGRHAAVLMLDLDHFKDVNDTFGHAAGDQRLVDFVASVSAELRDRDLLGRLGGEEFAVVVDGVTAAQGVELAERLRARAAGTVRAAGRSMRTTVSVGVTHTDQVAGGLAELLEAADGALYRAKAAGRDRVVAEPA